MTMICVGYRNSTHEGFDPEKCSDDEAKEEACRQAKERPLDPCLGVHELEHFQSKYNTDKTGDYELDPAFYWIRFLGIGKKTKPLRTYDRMYPQCRCARFGQSRFEPVKRTALDGKVWWCLYDRRKNEYVAWYKKKMRRQVLVQLVIDFRHGRLPYDPDPGFSKDWLMGRTAPEIAYLIDHRRMKDETY